MALASFMLNKKEVLIKTKNITAFIFSLFLIGLIFVLFIQEIKLPMSLMQDTVYPGRRFLTGGGYTLSWLLSGLYFIFPSSNVSAVFGNICEASSFLFFFPLVIILYFISNKTDRGSCSFRSMLVLTLGVLFFLVWIFVGFPLMISKITFMSMVQVSRAIIGLGVLNIVVLTLYCSELCTKKSFKPVLSLKIILAYLIWEITLIYVGYILHFEKGLMNVLELSLSFILVSGASYLLFIKNRYAIQYIAVLTFCFTFYFNPIVLGGSDFIYANPLSKKMLEINEKNSGDTGWIVVGDGVVSNLPRMIGLRSLGGTHFYPQFDMWSKIDPGSLYKNNYNRYGHVVFFPKKEEKNVVYIDNPQPDVIAVYIDPSIAIIKGAGITHLLVKGDDSFFKNNTAKFERIYTYSNKSIYKIK
jgi:hypothetical protein